MRQHCVFGVVLLALALASSSFRPTLAGFSCASTRCVPNADGTMSVSVLPQNPGIAQTDELFLYGEFSIDLKMPTGNTAGTIVAFYLINPTSPDNKDPGHSEIDLEFYSGKSETSFLLTSNIFRGSVQNLAQQDFPYDASDWHTYTIQWNSKYITWRVDGQPFRILVRDTAHPWPDIPMQLILSYWDCSVWCNPKPDFSNGPFTLLARNYQYQGCVATSGPGDCASNTAVGPGTSYNQPLSLADLASSSAIWGKTVRAAYGWDGA